METQLPCHDKVTCLEPMVTLSCRLCYKVVMELQTEVEEENFVESPYRSNTKCLHAIHTLKAVCWPQDGTEGALN